jgi:hypothetical protein
MRILCRSRGWGGSSLRVQKTVSANASHDNYVVSEAVPKLEAPAPPCAYHGWNRVRVIMVTGLGGALTTDSLHLFPFVPLFLLHRLSEAMIPVLIAMSQVLPFKKSISLSLFCLVMMNQYLRWRVCLERYGLEGLISRYTIYFKRTKMSDAASHQHLQEYSERLEKMADKAFTLPSLPHLEQCSRAQPSYATEDKGG